MPQYEKHMFEELDQNDPLKHKRDDFVLDETLIYLDGNSLGPLPKNTKEHICNVIENQWGKDLITSWNIHGWVSKATTIGDMIAPLVGAKKGTIKVGDSTSINVFKALAAALHVVETRQNQRNTPKRNIILSDHGNFPTDLYMAQGLEKLLSGDRCQLKLVNESEIIENIDEDVAIVMLTHVNFRSGNMYDMAKITQQAHEKGAVVIWDLAHSAGAVPIDLQGCEADFAVGCGYKYLNGGPGAPAFIYVADHLKSHALQPLSGWFGHKAPFEFSSDYQPAPAQNQFVVGTPSILSLAALEAGLQIWQDVSMDDIRDKSIKLGDLFIALLEQECGEYGFELASLRHAQHRGSHVSFAHKDGYAIMQALIKNKVIGDFRAPNLLRFGFTPLYTSYMDIWNAIGKLKMIMEEKIYTQDEFNKRAAVT